MKRCGFTLLELLIVIAILGILAFSVLLMYNQIRARTLLDLALDSFVTSVRDMKDQAHFGRDPQYCHGLYIAFDKQIIQVRAPFQALKTKGSTGLFEGSCDLQKIEEIGPLALHDNVRVMSLKLNIQMTKDVYVFAQPSTGDLRLYSAKTLVSPALVQTLGLTFQYGKNTMIQRNLDFDVLTAAAQKK